MLTAGMRPVGGLGAAACFRTRDHAARLVVRRGAAVGSGGDATAGPGDVAEVLLNHAIADTEQVSAAVAQSLAAGPGDVAEALLNHAIADAEPVSAAVARSLKSPPR
ncbi:hypothetical protein Caci_2079 [Catenulispora acidiphila DSM 44928]|uniref:Uncharacterized protein n=1 Tax=Catenulispora acidiphila (strain DSM 44928 / JCM 14897 / NBRC 102108 / NRRL B-24433 / ID139908) TaxID=479433 RepID=C7QG21_CATAD|nr:hypothetical protein Caci_2079 [Catenulispora acidiphila DSM 44928]